jgi:hypothetical protein
MTDLHAQAELRAIRRVLSLPSQTAIFHIATAFAGRTKLLLFIAIIW